MFKDGSFTYKSATSPWYNVEPQGVVVSSVAWAALIIFASLQTVALMFDFLIGFKKKGITKGFLFGVLSLPWKYSPLAFWHSVLRRDRFTKKYYQGDIPKQAFVARQDGRVKMTTIATLLALMLFPPIMDTLMIVPSLRRSKELTFKQAGFDGVAFGLNEDLSLPEEELHRPRCKRLKLRTRPHDELLVRLVVCSSPLNEQYVEVSDAYISISKSNCEREELDGVGILLSNCEYITFQMIVDDILLFKTFYAAVHTETRAYYIWNNLTESSASSLVGLAAKRIQEKCEGDIRSVNASRKPTNPVMERVAYKEFKCRVADKSDIRQFTTSVFNDMTSRITLIPALGMEVVPRGDGVLQGKYVRQNGMELGFLNRRERNVGLLPVLIFCVAIAFLRVLATAFLASDVVDGLDYVLKDRLGINHNESLICAGAGRTIAYRKKYQLGQRAHYGLEREELPEVQHFEGKVVIGDFNNKC